MGEHEWSFPHCLKFLRNRCGKCEIKISPKTGPFVMRDWVGGRTQSIPSHYYQQEPLAAGGLRLNSSEHSCFMQGDIWSLSHPGKWRNSLVLFPPLCLLCHTQHEFSRVDIWPHPP